jgi:hypothetical protein
LQVAARRVTDWIIEEYRGKVDVRCNRRAFLYDLDDLDEALSRIRRSKKYARGDKVVYIEDNGSRRTLRLP